MMWGVENVEWDYLAFIFIMLFSLKSIMEDEYIYFLYIGVDMDDEVYLMWEVKSMFFCFVGDNVFVIIDVFLRVG